MSEKTIKVLLIEDNPEDKRLIEEAFKKVPDTPVVIEWAGCLAEGIEIISKSQIDAVLLDLSLPDSTGLDTFNRLYEKAFSIPILVLTGLDNKEMAAAAVKAGAQDYLVKGDLNGNLLVNALRYGIERYHLIQDFKKRKEYSELIFRSVPSAIFSVDKERNIVGWNAQAEKITGYLAEEVIGKECLIFAEEPCKDKCSLFADNVEKPLLAKQCLIRRKDGSLCSILKNCDLLRDGTGHVIGGVESFEDISQSKRMQEALKESEERFKDITFSIADWVWEIDDNFIYTYCSKKVEEVLGYYPDEILGKMIFDFMPKEEAHKLNEKFVKLARQKKPIRDVESYNIRKDGHEVCMLINAVIVVDEQDNFRGYRGVAKNINERKETERKLLRAAEEWRATFDSMEDLISIQDKDYKITRVNMAYAKAAGMTPKETLNKVCYEVFHGLDHPLHNCPHRTTLETKKPTTIEHFDPTRKIHYEISVTPIFDERGQIIGTVHTARDITAYKKTQSDLQVSLRKFERLLNETSSALAQAVEKRDPYTAGHQERVAQLVLAIALEMELPDEKVRGVHMAAIVHDIGKIYVPAELLSKPGKLSDIEFALIKTHAQVGYDILKDIEFQWPIAQAVYQHHERVNGQGYPQGLQDKDILLEAKIIAVADVVEAMASHRPYRPALGIDQALEEIANNKGILYDSHIVNACIQLFKEKRFVFK
ncbi:MAG: PAS domain S-box protein [Candidatus Omnitrophota bacterium]